MKMIEGKLRAAGLRRGRVSIIPGKYHGSFGQRAYLYRRARRGVHPGGLVSLAEPEPLIRIVRRSQPIAFTRSPAGRSPTERCVHISHERALPRKRLVKPCTKRLV